MPVAVSSSSIAWPTASFKYFELALRHPELYDPAGDLVLVARDVDQMKLLFRVQRSVFGRWDALARALEHSGNVIYRSDVGTEEGPCVEMDEDAEDVAELISAHTVETSDVRNIWGLSRYDPTLPLKIGTILRLSHKYQLATHDVHLRKFFVSAWPQSLAAWDESERRFEVLAEDISSDAPLDRRFAEDSFPEAASAIRLAQDVDVPEVLPAAFYHLSRIPVTHNWDARRKASPTRSPRYYPPSTRSAKWDLLNANDLLFLLHGRQKIHEFMVDNWANSVFVACHASCSDPSRECVKHYHSLTSLHSLHSEDEDVQNDPLRLLQRRFSQPIELIQERYNVCKTCAESAWRISMAKRAELWELLPEFFGVSSDF